MLAHPELAKYLVEVHFAQEGSEYLTAASKKTILDLAQKTAEQKQKSMFADLKAKIEEHQQIAKEYEGPVREMNLALARMLVAEYTNFERIVQDPKMRFELVKKLKEISPELFKQYLSGKLDAAILLRIASGKYSVLNNPKRIVVDRYQRFYFQASSFRKGNT
jgi:hypothetical protein